MKQGYSPTFTNETFSLVHDLDPNQVPILHGSKTAHQNAWRVTNQLYQDTSHVDLAHTKGHTADLETSRTLLNCMISENAKWTTIDLTDFYLGTQLPHPEYIRIDVVLCPEAGERVTQYWIKSVLFPEGRTIPFQCLLDWLCLFF